MFEHYVCEMAAIFFGFNVLKVVWIAISGAMPSPFSWTVIDDLCICSSSENDKTRFDFLVLKTEYFSFRVNTMPAGALAPKVARASAGMIFVV